MKATTSYKYFQRENFEDSNVPWETEIQIGVATPLIIHDHIPVVY